MLPGAPTGNIIFEAGASSRMTTNISRPAMVAADDKLPYHLHAARHEEERFLCIDTDTNESLMRRVIHQALAGSRLITWRTPTSTAGRFNDQPVPLPHQHCGLAADINYPWPVRRNISFGGIPRLLW
jgi:hypothetical protein